MMTSLLFLVVNLRLPSILTSTLSWSMFSNTTPVLSHFLGNLPVWFWTATAPPIGICFCFLVYCSSLAPSLSSLLARALSLYSLTKDHSCFGSYLSFTTGIKSLIYLPYTTWAGDILVSGCGVFLYCNMALKNLSLLTVPSASKLSIRILFPLLTPNSAREFE